MHLIFPWLVTITGSMVCSRYPSLWISFGRPGTPLQRAIHRLSMRRLKCKHCLPPAVHSRYECIISMLKIRKYPKNGIPATSLREIQAHHPGTYLQRQNVACMQVERFDMIPVTSGSKGDTPQPERLVAREHRLTKTGNILDRRWKEKCDRFASNGRVSTRRIRHTFVRSL